MVDMDNRTEPFAYKAHCPYKPYFAYMALEASVAHQQSCMDIAHMDPPLEDKHFAEDRDIRNNLLDKIDWAYIASF